MNKTNIEWCDFTFNPVVGCKRACVYCYAKKISDRFKMVPDFSKPVFFPERLKQAVPKLPKNRNRIAKQLSPYKPIVFVGSMTDICYCEAGWLDAIINYCKNNPDVIFMFLTKNAKVYDYNNFPLNCWLGVTITGFDLNSCNNDEFFNINILHDLSIIYNTYVSIEPLRGGDIPNLDFADFVIVGAMTGPGAEKPKHEWVKAIDHKRIYCKDNILKYYFKCPKII